MRANAWKYGFIMSYPKGKSAVTCYAYEPWHYRYVGLGQGREGPRERAHAARVPVEAADRTTANAHSNSISNSAAFADAAAHAGSDTYPDAQP